MSLLSMIFATFAPATPAPVLVRVAGGDRGALRECIDRYGGLVWSIARRFEVSEAEDAVQEIFVDLWKSAARYDAGVASESTFIAMIARRRLIDRKRTRGRRPSTEPISEISATPIDERAMPDEALEAKKAAKALDKLRPEQKQVLVLSTQGLSHGEIAEQTGMPLGTVKAHARRGLLSIRAALLGVEQGELP